MPKDALHASDILKQAAEYVSTDRERQHGDKARNFGNIAELWSAYLRIRREPKELLDAMDVGHMMALMKVARTQLGVLNMDDYVDGAGYLGCAGQIAARPKNTVDPV